jgi:hypothetical protein
MATWAIKNLLVNVDSRKVIKSTTQLVDPIASQRLNAIYGDKIILAVEFVDSNGAAYPLAAGDTFDCGLDKDFSHVLDTGTAGAGYTGAIVSVAVAGLTKTIPTTGHIVLINGAGESDRIAYTNYAAGTFTVSATLTYTYLLGNTVQVEEELMAYSDNDEVDVAGDWADIDRATGKISIRLNCLTDSFDRKITASTANDLLSYLQIRRYPAGETQPTTMLQDWCYTSKAVIDGEGAPGVTTAQYLTQTSGDARYVRGQANLVNAGRATIVSAAGTITQTDVTIGEATGIISRAGGLTIRTTTSDPLIMGVNTGDTLKLYASYVEMANNTEFRWKDTGGTSRTTIELDSSNILSFGCSGSIPLRFICGAGYTETTRFAPATGALLVGTTTAVGSELLYVLGGSPATPAATGITFGGGVVSAGAAFNVGATKVVGAQGAAVADATGAGDVVAQLNALLARCRAHGLIAT